MREFTDPYVRHKQGPHAKRYMWACEKLGGCNSIVDLGCGAGYGSYILTNISDNVRGLDLSIMAIKHAKKNYPKVKFSIFDLEEEELPKADGATCMEVLAHLRHPQEFINKLEYKRLVTSSPINTNKDDGYIYRLHDFTENSFKALFNDWIVQDEIKQNFANNEYLTIYIEKI